MHGHRVVLVGLALACSMGLQAEPQTHRLRFEAALAEYEAGHWQAAFAAFGELADQGHADAARIAVLMLRHQRQLYGSSLGSERPERVARWLDQAAKRMAGPIPRSRVGARVVSNEVAREPALT